MRAGGLAICLVALVVGGGCRVSQYLRLNPHDWFADFDSAEARVRETGHELIICYTGARFRKDSPMEQALASEALKGMLAGKVKCVLTKSHEPDRRYVAQFGVDHAPALILVHRDGTYHSRFGELTAKEIRVFLASSGPPGSRPVLNPNIPRQAQYRWNDSFALAQDRALGARKPMLIVYYRKQSSDWKRLEGLLSRHEVYLRLSDMIHVRKSLPGRSRNFAITRFGALHLPALVIVRTDGKHDILELPMSYEAIVRFSENALDPVQRHGTSATASPVVPGDRALKP